MALTYSTLKTTVADWLERQEADLPLDTILLLAEARINRELRIRAMETALSSAISSGVVAVPAGYLELRYAYLDGSPARRLEITTPDDIIGRYPTRSAEGKPLYIARDGTNFIFGPYPDSGYTLKGSYYASFEGLSGSNTTNWLTANAPDLMLSAMMFESAYYVGDDAQIPIWAGRYDLALKELERQDRRERFPAGMPIAAKVAGSTP